MTAALPLREPTAAERAASDVADWQFAENQVGDQTAAYTFVFAFGKAFPLAGFTAQPRVIPVCC